MFLIPKLNNVPTLKRTDKFMSSLEKYLFSPLAHFLIGSFIFLELSWRSCLYIFEINPLSVASFRRRGWDVSREQHRNMYFI